MACLCVCRTGLHVSVAIIVRGTSLTCDPLILGFAARSIVLSIEASAVKLHL